jgi:hypothetical protein
MKIVIVSVLTLFLLAGALFAQQSQVRTFEGQKALSEHLKRDPRNPPKVQWHPYLGRGFTHGTRGELNSYRFNPQTFRKDQPRSKIASPTPVTTMESFKMNNLSVSESLLDRKVQISKGNRDGIIRAVSSSASTFLLLVEVPMEQRLVSVLLEEVVLR